MWFDLGDYLQPTPLLRELQLLVRLNEYPGSSQAELGRIVGLAPAMVNAYLRRFEKSGLIERSPHAGRGVDYKLTSAGERKRSYHVITFLAQLYALFDEVLDDLRKRIVSACGDKPQKLVLYGAGETGRMAYLALQALPHIELIGVVDDDPAKVGVAFFSHQVQSPSAVTSLCPDGVLIASWGHADEMARKAAQIFADLGIQTVRLVP